MTDPNAPTARPERPADPARSSPARPRADRQPRRRCPPSRTSSGRRSPTSAASSASCRRSSSGSSSRTAARFTNTEAKEALNFQITLIFACDRLGRSSVIVVSSAALLIWAVWIVGVVFSIIAFLQAKDGKHYRYPFAIRLIK